MNIKTILKSIMGYLAYYSVYPRWLSPLIHKYRGVQINDAFSLYIAPGVLIDSLYPEMVIIEDGACLTRGSKIICHINYSVSIQNTIGKENNVKPVRIEAGAFIGIDAIVLPGITIGRNAIVGAGSVVTADVPEFAIVAGNPARIIGDIRSK